MSDAFFAPRKAAAILDPAIATRNAGDEVIADAARRWIRKALPDHFLTTLPTHDKMGIRSHRLIRQAEYAIVGGSNILSSTLFTDRGWRVGLQDLLFVDKLILLAAGWRNYEKKPTPVTGMMLRRLLDKNAIHSVRDTHTKDMLASVGIENVVVTACVTMWQLTPDHIAEIPKKKGSSVVTTFSMRKPSPHDSHLIDILLKLYDRVYIWPQGFDDMAYVSQLSNGRAALLAPTLEAYDELLEADPSLDYLGIRLHAGIRALQKGVRSYIVSIDNRAAEISKDTNLPIVSRGASEEELRELVSMDYAPELQLPQNEIDIWMDQFKK
ncbi:polysaccharide pyruvyl transferase family protein [Rhodobacteraceae bacterium DSL-40]|uniref:polysaccharide pyruvyl transferase family protein n=1 Tax=Amaricoccus sp. B4 TaxID=3368557 RepID=UPI000DAD8C7E